MWQSIRFNFGLSPTLDEKVYPFIMKDQFRIEEYFSDKEIIKILCKKRALMAKKIHDNHFLRNISEGAQNPHRNNSKQIFKFFPPRSKWIRLNLRERNKRNTHSVELNAIELERTIWRARKENIRSGGIPQVWLSELNNFIIEIQKNALDPALKYQIPKPKVYPILKDRKKNEYRPISSFNLKDLIIIGQFSKYLTNCFDQLFLDCAYAFRSGINSSKSFNHHQAVRDIIEYNKSRKDNIFVAECDIKKFYDCVNHEVVREKFNLFVKKAKKELSLDIDPIAINIFESYLNCFSFNKDVAQKEKELLNTIGVKNGKIPWVTKDELTDVDSNPDNDNIGVPQGGALSCLIANIILDSVDHEVIEAGKGEIFYARFCDDMVLMHPEKDFCNVVFKVYQDALTRVKLISHKPEELLIYDSTFWGKKSKSPYNWNAFLKGDLEKQKNVPWLSFVGYQVRHDNIIRIRKTSIEKELKKQVSETDKIIKVIKRVKKTNINEKAVVFRLQQRLISMAVGRMQMNIKSLTMCWAAGFNVVKKNTSIMAQFGKLDRNREHQIKRMARSIKKVKTPTDVINPNPVKRLKYYGSKYSYHEQFI